MTLKPPDGANDPVIAVPFDERLDALESDVAALEAVTIVAPAPTGVAATDTPALQALIDAVPANGQGHILLRPGRYAINATLAWENKLIRLAGLVPAQQSPFGLPQGTAFYVSAGVTGISVISGTNGGANRSSIENIHLQSQSVGAGSDVGVRVRANSVRLENVVAEYFGSHGFHILSGVDGSPFSVDGTRNANCWRLEHCAGTNNHGDGLRVEGVDSNAGLATLFNASNNTGWGIYDHSAFGNTYEAPHLDGNTTGAIRIGVQSGYNRFTDIYKEGDATPAVQIDAGGEGHNEIDFRVLTTLAGQTITDNSATPHTNQITHGSRHDARQNRQPGLIAGPLWASPTTVALIANTAFFQRLAPPRAMTITKISFVVTTAASVNDPVDVGIYDSTGTRLGASAVTTGMLNSTGVKTLTLTAPVRLRSDQTYYAVIACGAIGGTAAVVSAKTTNAANLSVLFGTTLGPVEHGYYNAAHPLPASVATTPNANNTNPLVAVRED